jgi:Mg-chelatase subunit ChlD
VTETRLVSTTPLAGLRPLGSRGQAAIDSYRQLRAAVESRLGSDHAALFARPERRSDGGIDWFTDKAGPIRRLEELDHETRQAAFLDLQGKVAELSQLAHRLREGGSDSARMLGGLLEAALNMAGPESLWAVGNRPVVVLWGFAPEREVPGLSLPPRALTAPLVAPATDSFLGSPAAPPTLAEEAVQTPQPEPWVPPPVLSSAAAAPALRAGWWRWVLLALLLLISSLLGWKACAPLPPQVASATPAAPSEEVARAEARGRELEQQLAQLRREREEATAACPVSPDGSLAQGEPAAQRAAERHDNAVQNPPEEISQTPPAAAGEPAAAHERPGLPELPDLAEVPRPAPPPAATAEEPERSCPAERHASEAPEVALVVDSSGSMEKPIGGAPTRLDAAKRAIGALLDRLPGDVDVGLVEFRDCQRIRRDRFYSQAERDQLKAQVDSLEPGRGTPLARSVERAGAILSSQVPGTIIVVTDGKDSCGGDPCAAAAAIRQSRPNLTIHVIDIGSEGASPATCLAEMTGGKVYKPGSPVEFNRMVAEAGGQAEAGACP